jgi:hypothetical protein
MTLYQRTDERINKIHIQPSDQCPNGTQTDLEHEKQTRLPIIQRIDVIRIVYHWLL